jgi:hypothetical protein
LLKRWIAEDAAQEGKTFARIVAHSLGAPHSTSPCCRPRRRRWTRSCETNLPTPTNAGWIVCSHHPRVASVGPLRGST